MSTKFRPSTRTRAVTSACLLLLAGMAPTAAGQALTTAFIYQGELASAGTPALGLHDLRVRLFDAASGGTQIGSTLCSEDIAVIDGRFNVSLDFGMVFAGQKRFLEIEVRQDTGLDCSDASGYTTLSPRQELTATPNATFATSAGTAATATSATTAGTAANATSLNGQAASFYTNAANLTGTVPASSLAGVSGAGLTNLSGGNINAGTLPRSVLSADVQSGLGTLALDSLQTIGMVTTGNGPSSVAVSGSLACVVNRISATLQVFDMSNPSSPVLMGSVATQSNPTSVAVSGSFAYVVNDGFNRMQVFNISNPASPTLSGSVATDSGPTSVAVSGTRAYVVNATSNTMQIFDISNPAAPARYAGSPFTGASPQSIAVSGTRAYVVNGNSGSLQVFNVSTPNAPVLLGTLNRGGFPSCVAVSGSFAYMVNPAINTLDVVDISNPAAMTLAASIGTGTGTNPRALAVSGSFAFVVNPTSNTLQVYNVSNPAAPTLAGSIATGAGTSPSVVAASGSLAYVANVSANTLQIFSAPARMGFSAPLSASTLAGANGAGLTNLNAASITTGTLAAAQIPGLDASKISSGTFASAQIPSLDASKITTGVLPNTLTSGATANTPNTLVLRDASGNFSAGTVAAANLIASNSVQFSDGSVQTKASPWTVATASPGTEVIDQSQTGIDSGLPMQNSWQSFTAGISGRLTAVTIQTNGSSGTVTFNLNIYAGTGTGGTLLSSTPISFNTSSPVNAERKMLIPTGGAPVLTVGQTYTFQISGGPAWSGYGADANRYAGGVNSIGPSFDAYFKTHITSGYVEQSSSSIATPVGIGTSTPTTMLSVAGNANVTGNLTIGGTISAGTITANLSGNATNATNLNNQPASFYTNATNIAAGTLAAARLPASAARTDAANAFGNFTNTFAGPVAIGATSAAYNLDVVSGGDTQIALTGNGTLGARTWTLQSSSSSSSPSTGLNNSFQIIDRTAGIGRLLINPAGNVGIGTSTPFQTLDINGRVNVASGVIQRGGSAITGTSDLGLYSQVFGSFMRFVTNSGEFHWSTDSGLGTNDRMVLFPNGNLSVIGSLSKGGGSFKIDHPLDPMNKYLYHSFVESPDMMNIYNGNATTDDRGYATITMPDYFEALNRDFRYQLTVVDDGESLPDQVFTRVVSAMKNRQFSIKTSMPNVQVSWQVTGIRHDAWAEKNRIPNSVDKSGAEKGKLLHPEAFAHPQGDGRIHLGEHADNSSAATSR